MLPGQRGAELRLPPPSLFLISFPMRVSRDSGIYAPGARRKTFRFPFLERLLVFLELLLGHIQTVTPQKAKQTPLAQLPASGPGNLAPCSPPDLVFH